MFQEKRKKNLLEILNMYIRIAVIFVIIEQFRLQNYQSAILAVITLVFFMLPRMIEKKIHIEIPDIIESMILISIYASVILGEISYYYVLFSPWDTILHLLNGFITAAIGYSFIDFINHGRKFTMVFSPAFTMLYIICFAATAGVLWEIFEFSGDSLFGKDMQKDVYINQINSILLNPEELNEPVKITFDSVVINGNEWQDYVDIGLIDTMKDMILNIIGAIVFAVYLYFRIKKTGGNNLEEFLVQFQQKNKKTKKP